MNKELICIGCPMGCQLKITGDLDNMEINGNTCPRGADYARKELTHPTRIITSSVKVEGGSLPMVSVKTASDIPKEKIFECMAAIRDVKVTAPVMIGDIIIKDIAGTAIDIVATKNVYAL